MTLSDSGRHFRYKTARSNTLALAGGFFTASATWEALECATDTLDLFQIYKFSSNKGLVSTTMFLSLYHPSLLHRAFSGIFPPNCSHEILIAQRLLLCSTYVHAFHNKRVWFFSHPQNQFSPPWGQYCLH